MAEDGDQGGQWLNVTQAAHRLGWSRERLRSLARRGRIRTRRSNTGELMVLLTPELLARGGEASHGPAHRSAHGSTTGPAHGSADDDLEAGLWAESEAAALRQQAAALRVELARAQEQAAAVGAVAQVKEAALRELVEEMRTSLGREQAAMGRLVDAMRQALDDERARADRLEARLALPWWRRWLG
jgi:hypothetical protein